MKALCLSLALLGKWENLPPLPEPDLWETSRSAIQRREAAVQQQIAESNRDEERQNTYIIAGAVVAGLVLLGLISRSGKK